MALHALSGIVHASLIEFRLLASPAQAFAEVVYWNHDSAPGPMDAPRRAVEWAALEAQVCLGLGRFVFVSRIACLPTGQLGTAQIAF